MKYAIKLKTFLKRLEEKVIWETVKVKGIVPNTIKDY